MVSLANPFVFTVLLGKNDETAVSHLFIRCKSKNIIISDLYKKLLNLEVYYL